MSLDERASTFVKYLETTAKLPAGQTDIPLRTVKEIFHKIITDGNKSKLPVAEQNNYIISELQLGRCLSAVGKTEELMKRLRAVHQCLISDTRPATSDQGSCTRAWMEEEDCLLDPACSRADKLQEDSDC